MREPGRWPWGPSYTLPARIPPTRNGRASSRRSKRGDQSFTTAAIRRPKQMPNRLVLMKVRGREAVDRVQWYLLNLDSQATAGVGGKRDETLRRAVAYYVGVMRVSRSFREIHSPSRNVVLYSMSSLLRARKRAVVGRRCEEFFRSASLLGADLRHHWPMGV